MQTEERERDMISCALLRGYGERDAAAAQELEQLRRLRTLQNVKLCEGEAGRLEMLDMSVFCAELFSAAELALAGTGYHVECELTGAGGFCQINQRNTSNVLMNLLTNALLHGENRDVTIKNESYNDAFALIIENRGAFHWNAADVGLAEKGRGLCAASRGILAQRGNLILTQRGRRCKAAAIFPAQSAAPEQTLTEAVSCADLLFDRVSCVHCGLSVLAG
ncbi:MAG: hypothetical protein FWG82_05280 [Oscillospiraceae bacterium]|nr:hypothetical protein [Oscillospiraceae bacterium]